MTLFGIGPIELVVILILALIVFGPNKLPEIARSLGKALTELRRTSQEVTNTVMRELDVNPDPEKPSQPPAKISQALQDSVRKMVGAPPPHETGSETQMAAAGEPPEETPASAQDVCSPDEG